MIYFLTIFFIYGLNIPTLLSFDLWIIVACGVMLKLQTLHSISGKMYKNAIKLLNFLIIYDLILLSYIVIYTALKGIKYSIITFIFVINSAIYHYLFRVISLKDSLKKRIRKFSIISYIYYYFTGYLILLSAISLNYVVTITFIVSAILFIFRNTPNQMHTIFGVSNFIMFVTYAIYNSMYQSIMLFFVICAVIMFKNLIKQFSFLYLCGYVISWFNIIFIAVVNRYGINTQGMIYGGILFASIILINKLFLGRNMKTHKYAGILEIGLNIFYCVSIFIGSYYFDLLNYMILISAVTILSFCNWKISDGKKVRLWLIFPAMLFYKAAFQFVSIDYISLHKAIFLFSSAVYFGLASRFTIGKTKNIMQMGLVLFINIILYKEYLSSKNIYVPYIQLVLNIGILIFLSNIEFRLRVSGKNILTALFYSIDKYILQLMIILMTEVMYFSDQRLMVYHMIQMILMLTFGIYPLLKKIIRKEL